MGWAIFTPPRFPVVSGFFQRSEGTELPPDLSCSDQSAVILVPSPTLF
jgi:hypothetical protein